MITALVFFLGGLFVIAYCLLVRRLPPRQQVPAQIQLVAWLGVLIMLGALCFAMAAFLTER